MATTVTMIRFNLELLEDGGVTQPAPLRRDEVDAVIDTNLFGAPHLPGTSVAGALRARAMSVLASKVDELFGHGETEGTPAQASSIWVMNAPAALPRGDDGAGAARAVRWTTAIDRRRGAARDHSLRGVEMLPAGTVFTARLWAWDRPEFCAEMATLLSGWRPLLGRGTTTGHGRTRVSDPRWGLLDLRELKDLERWLATSGPELIDTIATEPLELSEVSTQREGPVVLSFTIKSPLLVGNGEATGREKDEKPGSVRNSTGDYIVPATTLKGIIRTRMEFLLRSRPVDSYPSPCTDQRCGKCLPCQWFGWGGGEVKGTTAVGLASRVRFHDAIIKDPKQAGRTHATLDRFTGGAAVRTPRDARMHLPAGAADRKTPTAPAGRGGKLYTLTAIGQGHFQAELDIAPGLPEPDHFRALLAQVVSDFNTKIIGIGLGTTRGYGDAEVEMDPAQPAAEEDVTAGAGRQTDDSHQVE